MNLRRSHTCLALLLLLAASLPCRADILLVNADGSGQYPTIQAAVDAAVDGDEVHLANGTYAGDGNREIRYHGKAIVVRSESGNAADVTIAPYELKFRPRAFIFDGGEGPDSILLGISTASEELMPPGAIFCDGSSPTISGCRFSSGFGTAVVSQGGEPTFEGCHFENNQSPKATTCIVADAAVIRECEFIGNFSDGSTGAASIWRASIFNCVFSGNSTECCAGSLSVGPGSVIEDTTIYGWSQYGASAVSVGGPATFRRCTIAGSGGPAAMSVGGCVTLQDCDVESISPPNACVRRIGSKVAPDALDPVSTDVTTWGQIKASYR